MKDDRNIKYSYSSLPYTNHFLQSDEWANVKINTKWKIHKAEFNDNTINIYRRVTPIGGVLYIPGCIPNAYESLNKLTSYLKTTRRNVVAKAEPSIPFNEELAGWFVELGWKPARNVQYSHTVMIDINKSDDEYLAIMKAKTRRDTRLAIRRGVRVVIENPNSKNLNIMYDLIQGTSNRKSFSIRDKKFLFDLWNEYIKSNRLKLFFAYHENDLLAGAVIITDGNNSAWYKDGGSTTSKPSLCGPRLLFFEIFKHLRADGIKLLDMCGVPDPETYQNSHMKGIYSFKTGFNPVVTKMMPAYELSLNSVSFKAWHKLELVYLKTSRIQSKHWY